MDFVTLLLDRVEQRRQNSAELLHLVIQDWIVFQRCTFDYVDEHDDPYISQIFLIEICTGRYIHRAQGVKIDHGTVPDPDLLASKLIEALLGSKACQGLPFQHVMTHGHLKTLEYPFPRQVSKDCQIVFEVCKVETDGDKVSRWTCPPCLRVGQDITHAKSETFHNIPLEDLYPKIEEEDGDHNQDADSISAGIFDDPEPLESDDDMDFNLSEDLTEEEDHIPRKKRTVPSQRAKKSSKARAKSRKTSSLKLANDVVLEDDSMSSSKKEVKCNHCSKVFPSIRYYRRHQREKRKLSCKACDQEVVTFFDLKKHIAIKHPQLLDAPYQSLWQNDEEVRTMKQPKLCFMCDRVFNGNVLLHGHKELYHELGEYKCDECQVPCLTFYDLIIHNYQQHSKVLPHVPPHKQGLEAITHDDGKIEFKRTKYVCQLCPAMFKCDTGYTSHLRRRHAWGLFDCQSCDEVGHFAKDISVHMSTFHPDNPEVKCPNCSLMVSLKDNPNGFLHHYEDPKHVGSEAASWGNCHKLSLQCHYCGKKYASRLNFLDHVKLHEGIERFKCSFCHYGTNNKNVLLTHEKSHLRERGLTNEDTNLKLYYDCDQCGKSFTSSVGVRKHKRTVHEGIKKKDVCKDCGDVFTNSQAYYRHRREAHGHVTKVRKTGRKPLD
ncbi:hypothetical protein TCAL_07436 [Tigriopus californicus]|uniref:C2H2-type domain-containing protein n=1 Tax=Tigriopus californicus TaxID=6832 RepID=A0A553N9S5_TIGCA|nr:zinc finger protein 564-like [Tigriopus californicus]TRY62190.1 hypothetical protein TCAL_07436 [Tigriopus californicus]|eukprot:TCALIF_07436-PA protein Name:"Similar to ZNF878 Zinc finger protein 878 (Homo sapiens)" AED:0.58 eAED:0.58 QI:0/-1/0/1/-1/1/1/0/659